MPGNHNQLAIVNDMLAYAKKIMTEKQIMPWIAYVTKGGVIVSRGYNSIRESQDPTQFSGVTAIRLAQKALDPGDLTNCSLYSVFQPTLMDFDIALWSGITDFIWCISQADAPEHYSDVPYSPQDYLRFNPGKISITSDMCKAEALALLNQAKEKQYWDANHLYP